MAQEEQIRNVVFDLGGVVIGRGYDRAGGGLDEFGFLQGDRPFPDYWRRYDLGTASRAEVVRAVADEHGLSLEQAAARLDRLMALFDPFDETVELIGELDEAGYGLYVLSNMPEEFMTYVERLDVLRHFDGLVISSRVHLAKPDPRIFALLGERYGVVPGQTLFVDDKPSNTEAAARLGFRTCTFRPDGAGCDAVRRQLGLVSGEEER